MVSEEGSQTVAAFSAVSEVIVCCMSILLIFVQVSLRLGPGLTLPLGSGLQSNSFTAPSCRAIHPLQGVRAAVLSFIYFRYVARRHASNYWTKQAVKSLSDKLQGVLSSFLLHVKSEL